MHLKRMGKCWSFSLPPPPTPTHPHPPPPTPYPATHKKKSVLNIFSLIEDESGKVDCNEVLAKLETINEDLAEIGIL